MVSGLGGWCLVWVWCLVGGDVWSGGCLLLGQSGPGGVCFGGGGGVVVSGLGGLVSGLGGVWSRGGGVWSGGSGLGRSAPGGRGGVWSRGVSAPGGWCLVWGGLVWGSAPRGGGGGVWSRGLSAPGGSAPRGVVSQHALRQTPPVNRMTDRCKNISLATTSLRPVNI